MQKYEIQPYHKPELVQSKVRFKFRAIVEQFIIAAKKGEITTPSGNRYKKSSMRPYKTLLLWIGNYESKFDIVYLDQINVLWSQFFTTFLMDHDMSKNSISMHLSRVKAILRRAHIAGLTHNSGMGIRCGTENTVQVYLTLSELKRLYHFDFSEHKGKARIRDVFILNCFLGMRISDFREFLKNPEKYTKEVDGHRFVHYFSKKTNMESVIPINSTARDILEKWNYDFGKSFSYQYYNTCLKNICKEAEIDSKVLCVVTKGGVVQEIERRKYDMVSSHTSRRTFASLAELAKIDRPAIMRMTGHLTEQSFLSYIRISGLDSALTIQNHPFFKIKL